MVREGTKPGEFRTVDRTLGRESASQRRGSREIRGDKDVKAVG